MQDNGVVMEHQAEKGGRSAATPLYKRSGALVGSGWISCGLLAEQLEVGTGLRGSAGLLVGASGTNLVMTVTVHSFGFAWSY